MTISCLFPSLHLLQILKLDLTGILVISLKCLRLSRCKLICLHQALSSCMLSINKATSPSLAWWLGEDRIFHIEPEIAPVSQAEHWGLSARQSQQLLNCHCQLGPGRMPAEQQLCHPELAWILAGQKSLLHPCTCQPLQELYPGWSAGTRRWISALPYCSDSNYFWMLAGCSKIKRPAAYSMGIPTVWKSETCCMLKRKPQAGHNSTLKPNHVVANLQAYPPYTILSVHLELEWEMWERPSWAGLMWIPLSLPLLW